MRPVVKRRVLLVPREHVVALPELPGGLCAPFLEAGPATGGRGGRRPGRARGPFVAMNNATS
ncbi:MAG: hypothetical protein QM655_02920 [Nocardioidaceae bacterium]